MSPFDCADQREQGSPRAREGFALPLSIMVLALLTMGLVAGFAMSTSEQSATGSQRAQARAYSYAQMGLELFLTKRKELNCAPSPTTGYTGTNASLCAFCPQCWLINATATNGTVNANLDTLPTKAESVTVSFSTGKAFVRAVPVWLDIPNGKGTYFVTSTGTDNQSALATGLGTTRTASRTVGVYVTWNKSTMNVMGALVSFSGITKNGTGEISGNDQCGSGASVAGITVPAEASVTVAGGAFTPSGDPPYDTLNTFSQDSAASRLDWAGIKSGTAIPADINYPNQDFPQAGTFASDTNYWPVIHVFNSTTGTFTLPVKGRGMLIVDGNLNIDGSDQWDGVILVGGQLTSNGNNVTSGTVMAGLNRLIGGSADAVYDSDLQGTKSYIYNSCSVAKATSSMARYTMVSNTWMDDVAGY
jgi:Tfp pilus assembly protein PilX